MDRIEWISDEEMLYLFELIAEEPLAGDDSVWGFLVDVFSVKVDAVIFRSGRS